MERGAIGERWRGRITAALWAPLILVLMSAALAAAGVGLAVMAFGVAAVYGAATGGGAPSVPVPAVDPGLATLAAGFAAAGVGGLYLLLARITFGGDAVDETVEAAQEIKETAADGGEEGDG